MSTSTTADVNANLKALTDAGVSVWLDQISRELVAGGELARLVAQDSLRGVTSNPTIFLKAILGSDDYDEEPGQTPREPRTSGRQDEIYDRIAVSTTSSSHADVAASRGLRMTRAARTDSYRSRSSRTWRTTPTPPWSRLARTGRRPTGPT